MPALSLEVSDRLRGARGLCRENSKASDRAAVQADPTPQATNRAISVPFMGRRCGHLRLIVENSLQC